MAMTRDLFTGAGYDPDPANRTRGTDVLKRVLDLVGLPIEGVRANLHDAPVVDPFRAAGHSR
jgi:hypothetical protein